jgi:hypothetical protein
MHWGILRNLLQAGILLYTDTIMLWVHSGQLTVVKFHPWCAVLFASTRTSCAVKLSGHNYSQLQRLVFAWYAGPS